MKSINTNQDQHNYLGQSAFKDSFNVEVEVNEIVPKNRVSENLNIAFDKKYSSLKVSWRKPVIAAASILFGIMLTWVLIEKNTTLENKGQSLAQEQSDSSVTNVLLNLDRVETQSSRIVPSLSMVQK